jgi:hypothetical protein
MKYALSSVFECAITVIDVIPFRDNQQLVTRTITPAYSKTNRCFSMHKKYQICKDNSIRAY